MFNREKHQLIMGQILKDIYTDVSISPLLGFKGGTCAYFFYKLPRFSVDLDFDLLEITDENKKIVFEKVVAILSKYRKAGKNFKNPHQIKEYLGISMFVAKKDYLFAGKLAALTLRIKTAMRDIFDIHYFAKNRWNINIEVVKNLTGKSVKEYLPNCIAFIEKIKDSQILQGLGELIESEKQKDWIRNHLKADAVFMLKNYQSILKIKKHCGLL